MELRSWLIRGTLIGLVVLGIGGRALMRIIRAHVMGRHLTFVRRSPAGEVPSSQ